MHVCRRGAFELAGPARARRDVAMPVSGHAADEQRAHQNQRETEGTILKNAYDALIAREQSGHTRRGRRIDAEEPAWYVPRRSERAVRGHVDAMIVIGGEIHRRESPIDKTARDCRRTCKQRRQRIAVTLRLQELCSVDAPHGADGAIDRRNNDARVCGKRPCARAQGAREEFIECVIRMRQGLLPVAHVRMKVIHKDCDEIVLKACMAAARDAPDEARQAVLRQEMLHQDEETLANPRAGVGLRRSCGHQLRNRASMCRRSATNGGTSNGGVNTATICAWWSRRNTAAECSIM